MTTQSTTNEIALWSNLKSNDIFEPNFSLCFYRKKNVQAQSMILFTFHFKLIFCLHLLPNKDVDIDKVDLQGSV